MRTISVRPLAVEDITEGLEVFHQVHNDFVKGFTITSVNRNESADRFLSAHLKSIFRHEWGFSVDKRHADGQNVYFTAGSMDSLGFERKLAEAVEQHGPVRLVIPPGWYVESDDSTEERRLIEPEGITITATIFVPFAEGTSEERLANDDPWDDAKDALLDDWQARLYSVLAPGGAELDHCAASLTSEEHIHVFDEDGILVEADVRGSALHHIKTKGSISTCSALEVDAITAQRVVLQEMRELKGR